MSSEYMSWKEFKDAVDKILREDNISEDTEIWYIDIHLPFKKDFEEIFVVSKDDNLGIAIG